MVVMTASCSHPPLPVHIVGAPLKGGAVLHYTRPYATFKIQVDSNGHVTGVIREDSTGDSQLDDASAAKLREWTFAPATENCKAVAGTAEYAVPVGLEPYTYADPCEHIAKVGTQAQPEFPDQARGIRESAQVRVNVSLDAAGRVTDASITQSSGNAWLDRSSYHAALDSTYLPTVNGCVPSPGHYLFIVTFDPDR